MPAFFTKLTRFSLPIMLAVLLLTAFTHVLAAPISPLPSGEGLGVRADSPLLQAEGLRARDLFAHLQADKRLYLLADAPLAGELLAPDDDWTGSGSVFTSTQPFTSAWALRSVPTVVFRSSVQDAQGQDVAWEFGDIAQILLNEIHLTHNVITETHILSGALNDAQILILPAFNKNYAAQVVSALTPNGLTTLRDFVMEGGTVYAQGTGAYLLEAAGLLPTGTVNLNAELTLPAAANNLGSLQIVQPDHRFTYNWQTDRMWLLNDPPVAANAPLTVIANYVNTIGGAQPALLYGETGQGRIIISVGHPTSPLYPNQHSLFFAALLTGMSERAELHGRAIQTYDPTPGPTVIPAYEANVPVSTTLCFSHLWSGTTLTNLQIVEEVNGNFTVDAASITPAPAALEIVPSGSLTNTRITWHLGDVTTSPGCLRYTAYTNRDSMAPGSVRFSTGFASFNNGTRAVRWNHRDFMLTALVPARIIGEHDKELDRFFYCPEGGLITDEFIFLENKEFSMGYNLRLVRYIPLIVPIVGLEDQREPLATNAGETVWMSNTLFFYDAPYYPLPRGITFYTQTLNLENWDGTTFVTMTTPGGYHTDPLPTNGVLVDGFFVTIPPEYAHAIRVTADHKLLLPAIRVEWDLGDFPGFWYEMPAVRYGIQSGELFGRSVSFTGDPLVGTVVVDATGGSVYTGLGGDPLIRRELLAPVIVTPPQVPTDTGLTYQDVWSRTHWLDSRAGFYDLFNWAACACGPGMGERHQRLNVTFGLWVDTDGNGSRETLITDFNQLRGRFPTRVQGDLDIWVQTQNTGQPVGANENFLESRIFRGLGFTISPRVNNSWSESYTSTYTTLLSDTIEGAYHLLTFQQHIPTNGRDILLIKAVVDTTPQHIEGLLKLHDGVRFVYRQGFAGAAQYEVHDTHVQAAIGASSDATVSTAANPVIVGTYTDTLFIIHELLDPYAPRVFEQAPYLMSWGFENAAATTYVGGRDGRKLLYSLLTPGDYTWIRVEINNNTGETWRNVQILPQPPADFTVTQLYTQNVPVPLWSDLPFLNITEIPDTGYGIYYFRLESGPAAAALMGSVFEIPITVSAQGLPTGFAAPPAIVGLRGSTGAAPTLPSGTASSLQMTLPLRPDFTPADIRLLTAEQRTLLESRLAADQTTIPNGTSAISYFLSLTNTVAFNFSGGVLNYTLPGLQLPPENQPQPVYVVTLADFHGTRAVRYAIDDGATLSSVDDFGFAWNDSAAPNFVDARGASLNAAYSIENITRTLTGEPLDFIHTGEAHTVTLRLTVNNSGNDVAADTLLNIPFATGVTVTLAPAEVTVLTNTLVWDAGDLAPGVGKSILVEFYVPAQFGGRAPASSALLDIARARFVNVYAGKPVTTRVASALTLPTGSRDLSAAFRIRVDTTGDGLPDTNLQNFALAKGIYPSALPGELELTIKTHTSGAGNTNWIEIPLCASTGTTLTPASGTWQASFSAAYSLLNRVETRGACSVLIVHQSAPVGGGDTITVRAKLQVNAATAEGALALTQAVRFVAQPSLDAGIATSHWRTNPALQTSILPNAIGTYSDTVFLASQMRDLYDPRDFNQDSTLNSWGFANASASSGVQTSLITLGESARARLQLCNSSAQMWNSVGVSVQTPAGVTALALSAANLPAAPWGDLPLLNRSQILPGACGVYYFEITTDATTSALYGQVLNLPVTITGSGFPTNFAAPPLTLGIRAADGSLPRHTLGQAYNLRLRLPLSTDLTPRAARLLTAEQYTLLLQKSAADQVSIPNGHTAEDYLQSLPGTLTFTFQNNLLDASLGAAVLPDGETPHYAVILADYIGSQTGTAVPLHAAALLSGNDSFGQAWQTGGAAQTGAVYGPSLHFTPTLQAITRTLTGEPVGALYAGETSLVTFDFELHNSGTHSSTQTSVFVAMNPAFVPLTYTAEISPVAGGLLWNVGNLPNAASAHTQLTLRVFVDETGATVNAPIAWGDVPAIDFARATFYHPFSAHTLTARVGGALRIAYGHDYRKVLSATFSLLTDLNGDGMPETDANALPLPGTLPAGRAANAEIVLRTQAVGITNTGIILLPLNAQISPATGDWLSAYTSPYSVLTGTQTANGFTTLYFRQNTPLYAADAITLSVTFTPSEGAFLIYDGLRLGVNGEPQPPLGVNAIRNAPVLAQNITPTLAATFTSTNFLEATLTDLFDPRPYPNEDYRAAHGFGNSSAQVWVGEGATTSLLGFGESAYIRWQINNNTAHLFGEVQLLPQPPAGVSLTPVYAYPFSTHWADAPFLHAANILAGNYGIYLYRVQITDAALQGKVLEIPATLQANGLPVDFSVPAARLAVRTTDGDAPQITLGGARQLGGAFTLSPRAQPLGMWLLNEMQYLQWQQYHLEDLSILPHTHTALVYLQSLGDGIAYGVANDILTYTLPADAAWLVQNPQLPLHLVVPYRFYAPLPGSYPLGGGAHTLTDGLGMTTTVTAPNLPLQIEGATLTYQAAVCGITRTLTQTPADVLYVGEENLVQVCLQLTNAGTHAAQTLQTRLPLLSGAQVVNLPPEITLTPQGNLLWEMAALEAAASQNVTVTLSVSVPVESGAGVFAATPWGSLPLVGAPHTRFVNAASLETVTQPFTHTVAAPYGYPSGWQVAVVPELFLAQNSAGTCPAGLVGTPVQVGFVPAYCDVQADLWIVLPAVNAPGAAQIVELALPLQNGFVLSPLQGNWQGSVSGTHTVFSDTHIVNGVEYLTLARSAPNGTAEQVQVQIRLHAKHDTTEGAVILHGGARWFFGIEEYTAARWQLGAAAYSQGMWMARNALTLETRLVHSVASLYTSTLLSAHPLDDLYGFAAYPDAPYRNLWLDSGVAVQVLAGGSEAGGWQSSLINLGDTLGLRVTIANRGALPLNGVVVLANAPAGVMVNPIDSQGNLPVSLRIQPAAFAPQVINPGAVGVYYFEITLEPDAALQGKVIALPLTIAAENLPVSLQTVTARFGVRSADGVAPRWHLGQMHNLQVGITPAENAVPLACRVFDGAAYTALVQAAAADEALLPRGNSALTYFESAGGAGTLTQQAGGWLCALPESAALPAETDARFVVFLHRVGAASVEPQPILDASFATAVDDFGSLLRAESGALLLPTRGARADVVVDSVMMTRTLTGATSPLLYVRERSEVQICFALHNSGNAALNEALVRFGLNSAFSPLYLPDEMTLEGQSLIWQVAGVLEGGEIRRACATFGVWVNPYAYAWLEDPDTSVTPIVWGNLPVFAPESLAFVDAYSGLAIELAGGETFTLPFGGDGAPQYQAYLPLAFGRALITFDAVQVSEAIPARNAQYPGETFYRAEITLPAALPDSGAFYLSASASAPLPIKIDDTVFISVDGVDVFSVTFSSAQIPPEPQMVAIPLEMVRSWRGKTIVITYRDQFGYLVEASEVWLIWVP